MNTTELVRGVCAVYANCRSYRDVGEDVTVFDPGSARQHTRRRPFRTLFLRPDLFFFEFRSRRGDDEWDRYVVQRKAGRVRTWWSAHQEDRGPLALKHAIAGATGISGGAAYAVPRLLLPNEVSGRMTVDARAMRVADAEADLAGCWVLEQSLGDRLERLWIDKTTLLIRRVVEPEHEIGGAVPDDQLQRLRKQVEAKGLDWSEHERILKEVRRFRTASIRTYDAQADIDIDPAEFEFEPPAT